MPNYTSPSAAYRPAHQGFPGTLPEPAKPALSLVCKNEWEVTMQSGHVYFVAAEYESHALCEAERLARVVHGVNDRAVSGLCVGWA